MSILVIAEHDNAQLGVSTRNAVAAAAAIGGDVHVLVAGSGARAVADQAAQVASVSKVLLADGPSLAEGLAENLSGVPRTLMITATDPLRDEGLEYAEKLRAAGVAVTHLDYPQLIHGFLGMAGVLPAAKLALEEMCQQLADML